MYTIMELVMGIGIHMYVAYPYILGLKQVVKGRRRFSLKQMRKHVCMRSNVQHEWVVSV